MYSRGDENIERKTVNLQAVLKIFLVQLWDYLKSLFSGSTFILFFSIALIYLFVEQLLEINFARKRLVEHTGVVEKKYIQKEKTTNDPDHRSLDSVAVFRIKLSRGPSVYSATGQIAYLDYAINVGDTLKLYTKPLTSIFGNWVSDESGSYTTHDANHIYHLIGSDGSIVINFDRHKQRLKKTIWIYGLCGVILFIIYLYQRPWRKSWGVEHDPGS